MARLISVSLLISLLGAGLCAGRTITINPNGTADFTTIQAAINNANDGDTIEIRPGTYAGDGNRDIDFLGKTIIVRSTDPNDPNVVANTIIDWQDADRAFLLDGCTSVVLAGMTITNGKDYSGAGAIKCIESTVSMNHCVFSHNGHTISSGESGGGAVRSIGSQIVITDCAFTDNWTERDGGAVNATSSTITLSNCTFRQNKSMRHGGAVQSSESQITIADCTFTDNWAENDGGAANAIGSTMTMRNCTLYQNCGRYNGGAITSNSSSISKGSLILIHCTVTANTTEFFYGGGVYIYLAMRP